MSCFSTPDSHPEIINGEPDASLAQEEECTRPEIDLAAEEKALAETPEHKKSFSNEAEQKRLAELHKKETGRMPDSEAAKAPTVMHAEELQANLKETNLQSPGAGLPPQSSSESGGFEVSQNPIMVGTGNNKDAFETLFKHEAGGKYCFLNGIIQSLWHLKRFREKFLVPELSHTCIGDSCAVCVLCDIFKNLRLPSTSMQTEALRDTLSKLYPDKRSFQKLNRY